MLGCQIDFVIRAEEPQQDPFLPLPAKATAPHPSEEFGWQHVTVVTSEFHVTRTRLVFSYCVDVSARVVASDSGLGLGSRVERALREAVATVATLPAYDCPGRPDQG